MPSYNHTKIIEDINRIDALPGDDVKLSEWIKAQNHIDFLKRNALSDELVICAFGPYSFVTSFIVPDEDLFPLDKPSLLNWSGNPYSSMASYVYGGGRQDVWVENTVSMDGCKAFEKGKDLVFGRTFEGWSGQGRNYFEINQEYTHLTGIHWRPEHGSYCHFDQNGDLEHVVSITTREDSTVSLVSFNWAQLEEYLTFSKCSLVRMFDFTLLRRDGFNGWNGTEDIFDIDDTLFYKQCVSGLAAYTRGVQIIRPRTPAEDVYNNFTGGWLAPKKREYADFIAHDWRNKRIVKISTDPNATTNYFEAADNS